MKWERHLGAWLALACLAVWDGPAQAARGVGDDGSVRVRVSGQAGDLGGVSVRPEHLPAVKVRLATELRWQKAAVRLRLPFSLSHRQTFGGSLSELRARGGLDLRVRQSKALRIGVGAGLEGVLRPRWPDLYQPIGRGRYEPTGRFSYLSGRLRVRAGGNPLRHNAWSAAAAWQRWNYRNDPNYDPDVPTHLVPGDRTRLEVKAGWHVFSHGHRGGGGLELWSTRFAYAYARDGFTGMTHAAPGGPPQNPLQHFVELRPTLDYRWRRRRGVLRRLAVTYLHRLQIDTYDGYYSFSAPSPRAEVELKPRHGLRTTFEVGAEMRRYGQRSYAEGDGHPPLDGGTRRASTLVWIRGGLALRLMRGLYLTFDLSYRHRRTNFPDYVPRVFPASRTYDVHWDYDNVWVFGGVRWGRRVPLTGVLK